MTIAHPRSLFVSLVGVVLLSAACGSSAPEQVAAEGTPSDAASTAEVGDAQSDSSDGLPFGLQRCDQDFGAVQADPSYYRDEPVYVGNNQPVEELRAWAKDRPGYEDIWIDRDHNGWVSIGFADGGAADRQAELEEAFPDYGAVAVELPYSLVELRELEKEIFAAAGDGTGFIGAGHQVSSAVVRVRVNVLDEQTLASFAEFADRPACFEGIEPDDAVQDGPQPPEGDGWRLLALERTGESYRTGVATNDQQYEALWTESQVTTERAAVDFENEIVIWFGAVYGSGCELRMDDVIFDIERATIHGQFVVPGNPGDCNADANPEAYLVAVDRNRLPEGPFRVQLNATNPPSGATEERTVVDADLSQPGSTADAGAIGEDPDLVNQADLGYVIGADGVLEPGFGALYRLELACDFATLGPVNGVMWQATDAAAVTEASSLWLPVADDAGEVLADVLLEAEPPSLSLSASGHTVDYLPAPVDSVTDCP